MVIGMLQILPIYAYSILYIGATLSFLNPLVVIKFNILSDMLIEPFLVATLVGNSILIRRVIRSFPISLPNIVT